MRIKLIRVIRKPPWLRVWSAITGVALVVALVLTFLPMQVSIDTDGLLSISLSPGQTQAQEPIGKPAYQVLIPNEIGSETGLQVFPPKLQDGGTKTNWLAVQCPQGLDVPVGTMILDEDGDPIGVNTSIGGIYIDAVTGYLIISPYALSDKCSKQIDITDYTTYGNETVWDETRGRNITSPLRAKFRSYIYGSGSDTYQLENTPQVQDTRDLPVVSITVYAVVRGTVTKSSAATRINTATKKYNGDTVSLGISGDTRIETTYTLNPGTGNPWTWEELDGLEVGVTLKDSAECSYVYVQVETEVHSQTFFPITPVEITPGVTDSWQDVDCSSHIASGATGVVLHIYNNSGAWVLTGLRKNGSTDARTENTYPGHLWASVGVDSSRILEIYLGNIISGEVWLVGYTMSGVTFFTNAYDKSTSTTSSWVDVNCSSECPGAVGLIFEGVATASAVSFGVRKNGSTDDRHPTNAYSHICMGIIIGCDGSQVCEQYISSSVRDLFLVGYITDGCTFNTNATDVSLSATASWTDVSALPSGAVMGFIEVVSTTVTDDYGLRKNGSSEDTYHNTAQHSFGFVECDSSQIIEGKIGTTAVDFFVVGYATAAAVVAPTVTTQAATDILCTNFTANGTITDTGGENCHTRGFCYFEGTSGDPTTANSTVYDNGAGSYGTGAYTKTIGSLSCNVTYRVRAYAINSAGTGYGTTVSVTTGSPGISDTPDSYGFGILQLGTTVATAVNYFTLNNTGDCAVDVTIQGTDLTSGTQSIYPITPVEVTPGTPDSWQDVDVSSYVASGATGVLLHVVNNETGVANAIGLRKNGSTDNRTTALCALKQSWGAIGVDANRIFEAYVADSTYVDIYLVGYTMSGVTFFTNAYDKSLGTTTAWTDIDCSTEAPDAIGFIFEVISSSATGYEMGVRKNGSADDRHTPVANHNTMTVVIGCDGSQICEGYIENTGVDFYLVGYITAGCTFNTNATDASLSTSGSWLDLSVLPAGAIMGFIEVATPNVRRFGLRENGSSEDLYYFADRHPWAFVECDENRVIEGKIEHTEVDFFVIGYATGAATWTLSDTATPGDNIYGLRASTDSETLYESYTTGAGGSISIYDNYWGCQTFTPSTSHTITSAQLDLYRYGSPGTVLVSIRATSGGQPTGSDLCLASTNGDTLTTDTGGEWRTITFTSTCTLSSSTQYAIVVRAASGDFNNSLEWRDDASSPTYSGGSQVRSGDSGSSWTTYSGADFLFKDYGVDFDVIVKKTATYNTLVSGLAEDATQGWTLALIMPTSLSGYDSQQMSGTITLVASAA